MPNSCPSEERFPLLLLFLEDGQRSSKHRRILIDKSRYQGIASGATAVITQWPGHLTACWLTAIVIGLAIILVSMMMFAVSLRPGAYMLTTRCKQNHFYNKENQTVTIHLVHGPSPWFQSQLDTLEQIAQNYQKSSIEVIVIQREIDFIDNNINNENNMQVVNFSIDESEENSVTTTEINNRENIVTVSAFEHQQTDSQTNSLLQSSGKTSPLKSLKRVKRIKRFLKHRNITPGRKKRFHPWENFQLNINIGTKKLLKMLLNQRDSRKAFLFNNPSRKDELEANPTTVMPKIQSIQDLLKLHSNIHIKNSTFEEIFKQSPLYLTWQNMNQGTRLFAIRVLEMWNYAGITFDMPAALKLPSTTKLPLDDSNVSKNKERTTENDFSIRQLVAENFGKYKKLITVGFSAFENLPEGLVTVDDEGFHMETKTVCHAYFGEILINLKKATMETMPTDVIRNALKTFCKRGAVDGEYCKAVMR